MRVRRGAVALWLAVLLALTGAAGGGRTDRGHRAQPATVEMTNDLTFTPDTVRIAVGGSLEWRNTSDLVHTVTADPDKAVDAKHVQLPPGTASFDSGRLEPGATFSRTFSVPGTYRYFCVPHEAADMIGMVIVSER